MSETEPILVEKLVHGGQAIASLPNGKRILLWNALPGELVIPRITKQKRSLTEGIAETIVRRSPERLEPRDEAFLSTSPWQIMEWSAENTYKRDILRETFEREHVRYDSKIELIHDERMWGYRNKMEYSFWADEDGLHLALFHRGSHGKRIVQGSSIAMPQIDETANRILGVLNDAGIRGSQLKTLVIRANQQGDCLAAVFVKDDMFKKLENLEGTCRGITVCYSNPKSPASVLTSELYAYGETALTDRVLDTDISYDVHSFFQVNLPVFERAGNRIKAEISETNEVVDLYSGVGTIGLACGAGKLVEIDERNIAMAEENAKRLERHIEVVHASAESATETITGAPALIVDPPRAGLHSKLVGAILEKQPPKLLYLSCNPITQARDIALLQEVYDLRLLEGYNFFPRTPHIESLAILMRR